MQLVILSSLQKTVGQGRKRHYIPENVPEVVFNAVLNDLSLRQMTEQQDSPGFAAHRLMRDDTSKI